MPEDFKFSLSHTKLELHIGHQRFKIAQGLDFISAQSLTRQGTQLYLNALAIERAIYVIEELLEQLYLDYAQPRIAMSADEPLKQLSALFFNAHTSIDRVLLEDAFNALIARTEYYVHQVPDITLLLYFIFIREMMHHLNVERIEII
jgi:hypothetical protein